ncbi:hypothetical protein like AT2G04240 [Hibiscus trionum]|uniref:RING-type domain-containing protein n=1 Tax=Hibiscus trionum TaxID=183268 RepID=A0A9W7LLJ2_HIBTR|nr:hypothetical protein like AT2G04240 [Hibiscus trionum]
MGLSSLPTPSEGMLCVLLVNTALSLSVVKGILSSILRILGIHLSSASTSTSDSMTSSPDSVTSSLDSVVYQDELSLYHTASEIYIKEYRSRIPTIRFDALSIREQPEYDCPVCRCEFVPESEIDVLPCSHLFHKECLETWLRYLRGTCPLCRFPLLYDEVDACYW